jgi:hypothetical protein
MSVMPSHSRMAPEDSVLEPRNGKSCPACSKNGPPTTQALISATWNSCSLLCAPSARAPGTGFCAWALRVFNPSADGNRFMQTPLLYHQCVDKLFLFVFGPLAFAAVLLVIATGIRCAVARFRSRPTPEELKATYEAYRHRLLHPQPETVEKELGKLLPERLLRLYEDNSAIQAAGFQLEKQGSARWWPKRWQVYCFEPLDLASLNESPYEEELGPGFCFATTGRGSWYWIAASDQRAKDSPVIFLDYDGGRSHGETVAASLDEFLNFSRTPSK